MISKTILCIFLHGILKKKIFAGIYSAHLPQTLVFIVYLTSIWISRLIYIYRVYAHTQRQASEVRDVSILYLYEGTVAGVSHRAASVCLCCRSTWGQRRGSCTAAAASAGWGSCRVVGWLYSCITTEFINLVLLYINIYIILQYGKSKAEAQWPIWSIVWRRVKEAKSINLALLKDMSFFNHLSITT